MTIFLLNLAQTILKIYTDSFSINYFLPPNCLDFFLSQNYLKFYLLIYNYFYLMHYAKYLIK